MPALKLSRLHLALLTALYLYVLNALSGQSLAESAAALWCLLALLILLLLASFLPALLYRLCLMLLVFSTSAAVFIKKQYGVIISEDLWLTAFNSEMDLAWEMASWPLFFWLAGSAFLPMFLLAIIRLPHWQNHCHVEGKKCLKLSALLLFFMGIIFYGQSYQFKGKGHIRDERFARDMAHFSPLDVFYYFKRALRSQQQLKNLSTLKVLSQHYTYWDAEEDLLLVLVLGETSRGSHFGINGYPRNTTPLLSQIQPLYSFLKAESCDTLTLNSMYCLASPMRRENQGRIPRTSAFSDVLKHLGYHIEIYSLQNILVFYRYLQPDVLVSKYQILAEQKQAARDEALLPYVRQAIASYRGGKRLLMVHTLGSHQSYADRFDEKYAHFQPFCRQPDVAQCPSQELLNAYDNSIVAVDAFLYAIIQALQSKKALLIYLSDHGESLGENGLYFHGLPLAQAPAEQFDIPFIFWLSESFRASPTGQKTEAALQKHLREGKKLSHDHLFHSLLGCAGVHSPDGGLDLNLNLCN